MTSPPCWISNTCFFYVSAHSHDDCVVLFLRKAPQLTDAGRIIAVAERFNYSPRMKWMCSLMLVAAGCAAGGTQVEFDLDADWSQQASFYRFPYPSDLRLGENGGPDLESD